jgi:hypothetical protein
MKKFLLNISLIVGLSSCACQPEDLFEVAFSGMESLIGEGLLPSEELMALGDFQGMSIQLGQNSENGTQESEIFLRLENGSAEKLSGPREILARKCAEIYLRDFENRAEYEKITIQLMQTDPTDSENIAMEEYSFDIKDF